MTISIDFLSRSGCTLSKLCISKGPTEGDFLRYLLEVPSMIDLAILSEMLSENLRGLMGAQRAGWQILVPSLEHMTIRGGWCGREEMVNYIKHLCTC